MAGKSPKKPRTDIASPRDIFDRLRENDESAVPEFREIMKAKPAIAEILGNMARVAEQTLIERTSGNDLLARESFTAKLEAMRAELAGAQPSAIERLLVERVAACWLQVYTADTIAADVTNGTWAEFDYYQRRQDRAHRRFLSAVRTLATVRRLALPTLVAVNVTGMVAKEVEPALESRPLRLSASSK